MMLLTAGNALVRDRQSFLALRRFGYLLNTVLTLVLVLIALPPVFRALVDLMGLPTEVTRLASYATAVMIPWPAAIGYRRFYQGIMVRHGLTRRVAYGTVVRLISMSATAAALAWWSPLPGATIGGLSLTVGVICEAAASRWMSWQAVTTLLRSQRACWILSHRTRTVTIGTAVEAVGISVTLAVCVGWLDLPGAVAAAVALITGRIGANVFLHRAMRSYGPTGSASSVSHEATSGFAARDGP
jgi:hypothetical protein